MLIRLYAVVLLVACIAQPGLGEEAVLGIPLKPDPPLAIDGDLSDWAEVPGEIILGEATQVVWGRDAWQSTSDLSGTVKLAWRVDDLCVAVNVVDDELQQTQQGDSIWRGDHVELYLDAQPERELDRDVLGTGQFQLAFSPGNFKRTGDASVDGKPQSYCYQPRGSSLEGIRMASMRTERGWTVEAAIPWRLLGIERPARGMPVGCEIALSDTDSPEPRQESLMTTSSDPWARQRSRLTPALLAGTDGQPPPRVRRLPIFEELKLAQGKQQSFAVTAPAIPEGREAVLVLRARMDTPKVAGHTPALSLTLNGQKLTGARLLNKPRRVAARNGALYSMAAGERLTTYYAPDFSSPDTHPHYGLLGGVKACNFELRITDLLRGGNNELIVENRAVPSVQRILVVGAARIEFRVPLPPDEQRAGPPIGPLPVIEPRSKFSTDYGVDVSAENGAIAVRVAGRTFSIRSRFSTPEPKWVGGSNRYFRHERRVDQRDEALVITDTLTNLTADKLAVMHRHELELGDGLKQVWLAGLKRPTGTGSVSEASNPTTFAAADRCGIGLIALDDVFRTHATNYVLEGTVGLADNYLALQPNGSHTAQWAIVPTSAPDYWDFLNAARRLMNANFTIKGAFAFLRADPRLTGPWTDEQTANFIKLKDARYVCASIGYPRYRGRYAHGTAFQKIDYEHYRRAFERRRRLVPGVQNLVYFHCFLDVTDEAPQRFGDARVLRPNGEQANYGKPHQRIFFPTQSNSYGPQVAKNVDIILDEIGAEGVYWDEIKYSACKYHYGEPWDGVSCDVDRKRMTIARLKSSVTLLTRKWRLELAKRILARGPLIANGVPVTQEMAALRFPTFVETGSITNCTRAQLHSPIALGDHLTERSELDAYHTMLAALDFGCVYHWYNDLNVVPSHHHLTRYMYPLTPLELHEGYVIGQERIVTNRSGLYGWGDGSRHEVHVFDHTGREVEAFDAPPVTRDGRTYTELRLGEDWSAAVIRK